MTLHWLLVVLTSGLSSESKYLQNYRHLVSSLGVSCPTHFLTLSAPWPAERKYKSPDIRWTLSAHCPPVGKWIWSNMRICEWSALPGVQTMAGLLPIKQRIYQTNELNNVEQKFSTITSHSPKSAPVLCFSRPKDDYLGLYQFQVEKKWNEKL